MDTIQTKLDSIMWPDSSFESVELKYDNTIITIRDINEQTHTLIFHNHICFHQHWHWDENIIDSVSVTTASPLLKNTLDTIGAIYPKDFNIPGNPKRIDSTWYHITITFIDDATIDLICAGLDIHHES